jgi:putative RNA 2'-phosphotransferase
VSNDNAVRISMRLSYVLRHRPDTAGIELDANGWVDVESLVAALSANGDAVLLDEIEHVVATSEKQRFELVDGRIRAAQGHSVSVDLDLTPLTPPDVLFHGTVERFLPLIAEQGLRSMERSHVHLSADETTATKVGQRRGVPVILQLRALQMNQDGHDFFRAANGVWLTVKVPPNFLVFP